MTFEFELFSSEQFLMVADKVLHISEAATELYPNDRDVLLMACVMLRSAAAAKEDA